MHNLPIRSVLACALFELIIGTASGEMSPCGGISQSALPSTTFNWSPINGQLYYRVQLDTDPSFGSPNVTQIQVQGLTLQMGLQFNTHYYWRIQAGDGQNWGAYSNPPCDFFTEVGTTAPTAAPPLVLPEDGVTGQFTPYLQWVGVAGATGYTAQVATNSSFTGAADYNVTNIIAFTSGLAAGQTYYWRVRGTNSFGAGPWSLTRIFYTETVSTQLNLKVFLHGPFDLNTFLMNDNLRTSGLLPTIEPYTALGYSGLQASGVITSGVLATTGNNAPVDWILVQARHGVTNAIIRTWPLVLQRDGDVMKWDGTVPAMTFPMRDVKIAVLHRNHLGFMTSGTSLANGTPINLDMTNGFLGVYGGNTATIPVGTSWRAMWEGDCTGSGVVKYTGSGNDRDPILLAVGSTTPNATVTGYRLEDVNMDGLVKYTGTANDRDPILTTVGSTTPNSTRTRQLP